MTAVAAKCPPHTNTIRQTVAKAVWDRLGQRSFIARAHSMGQPKREARTKPLRIGIDSGFNDLELTKPQIAEAWKRPFGTRAREPRASSERSRSVSRQRAA